MNLKKIKAKEKFLSEVEEVDRSELLKVLAENTSGLDLYTYFVTLNAHKTDEVDLNSIQELILKLYSDWYFLTKNSNITVETVKLFDNYRFSPLGINKDECFSLVRGKEFGNTIPISIEYTNKLQEKFFTSIRVDKLYNMNVGEQIFGCRLYLNLPSRKILLFVEEFLERCYLEILPCNIKFFNSDDRCDNVIIYCDYEYAEKIVDVIETIKEDYSFKLDGAGEVNPLLGKVNDYIGFGEQPVKGTYFTSRTFALESIQKMAMGEVLKNTLIAPEERVIYRKDGTSYSPTEYLAYLIEKITIELIDEKIYKLESLQEKMNNESELASLYKLRENLSQSVDIDREVKKLKKSFTRNENYSVNIEGIGSKEYNFIEKLYNLFTPVEDKYLKKVSEKDKKKIVSSVVFRPSVSFEGVDTKEYLYNLFKHELSIALDNILENEIEETKYSRQSSILNNLKVKSCMRLKAVIKAILNDDDDGKELVDSCINDYIRILSCDSLESVQVEVNGIKVNLDENISEIIKSTFPQLKENVDNLTLDNGYIDAMLIHYGINPNNFAVNNITNIVGKKRNRGKRGKRSHFYYDPEVNYKDLL